MPLVSGNAKAWLKVVISLILFGGLFLFGNFDLKQSWQAAQKADKIYLFLVFLLCLSYRLVLAKRWQILAAVVGFHESYKRMLQWTFIGFFFNSFFPSTIGGDFSRCYYLSKNSPGNRSEVYLNALSTLLMDRLIGIATILLFGIVGLLCSPTASALPLEIRLPIFFLAAAIFFVSPFLPQASKRMLGESNWLSKKLNQSTISEYWKSNTTMIRAFHLSIIVQILAMIAHVLIGLSLGISFEVVPLSYYFVLYSLVAVISFITPSVNGIGVREWSYTYLLAAVHVDRSIALTYSLVWLTLSTLCNLLGGLVYLCSGTASQEKKPVRET